LDYFGINEKYFDEIDEIWEEKDEVPLSDLVPYGLKDGKQRWYGCYVNDIKSDEIIEIKIAPPGEYDKGEWKKFTSPPTPIKSKLKKSTKPKINQNEPPKEIQVKSFKIDTSSKLNQLIMIDLENYNRGIYIWKNNIGEENFKKLIDNLENYDNNSSSKKYVDEFIISFLKKK
jgi:hypothetical protein